VTLAVRVDPADPTPPFEQLRRQLAEAIQAGALTAGSRLPPVRQLAGDLGLAPGTVMRAYGELAASGLVVAGRARGTIVAAVAAPTEADRRRSIAQLAQAYAGEAQRLGASPAEALAAISRALGVDAGAR